MRGDGRLRVLVGVNRLEIGGTQVNAVDTAWALRERGHEVVCFAERETDMPLLEVARNRNIEIELLEPSRRKALRLAAEISRLCDRHRIGAVLAYSTWLGWAAFLGPNRRNATPVVTVEYGMTGPRHLPRHMPLVVGTAELVEQVSAWHAGPVALVEPPVDTDRDSEAAVDGIGFRNDNGIGPDEVVVATVSRFSRYLQKIEAVERTIDAIGELDRPGVRLVIAGGGEGEARIMARVADVNRRLDREAVLAVGLLRDPRPAYAAADIMVGMGGSAIRSLAFGKPLVVLGEDGFSLQFGPDTEAVFFEQGFFGSGAGGVSLATQLGALVDDAARRAELGSYGRKVAVDRYSLWAAAERVERLLVDAADHPRSLTRWVTDAAFTGGYRTAARIAPAGLRDRVRRLLR